ncbi:SRPBCC domain-containing protein [Emticicia sp. BO119]|uniref:SRPBCC domain-containing protein n=1 Tax=Emticicia sp. BO119 TaxID=2757768 RepID=UPI0015F05F98|nr:SRPBCC domain-containing protein [Emticicia sp. BO119]MBA4852761.1 SRPBCC domain-containing protein [Emticicia sp. BO119]
MNSTQNHVTDIVPEIITTRIFNQKKELLFEAYNNPAILAQWWGPKGFTNTIHEFDMSPEGKWFFTMHGPDGKDYKNKIIFREIVPFEKIVFDHASGPYYKGTVIFADTDMTNHTRLSYCMVLESLKVYNNLKDFIIGANEENFDRLEETLNKLIRN